MDNNNNANLLTQISHFLPDFQQMWEISYWPGPAAVKLNHANAHLTLSIISDSQMTAPLHLPFREKGRRWVKTDSVGQKQKVSSLDESVKRIISNRYSPRFHTGSTP